jgi:hypothetical protein
MEYNIEDRTQAIANAQSTNKSVEKICSSNQKYSCDIVVFGI